MTQKLNLKTTRDRLGGSIAHPVLVWSDPVVVSHIFQRGKVIQSNMLGQRVFSRRDR